MVHFVTTTIWLKPFSSDILISMVFISQNFPTLWIYWKNVSLENVSTLSYEGIQVRFCIDFGHIMTTLLRSTWPKCVAKCDKMCLCLVTFSANLLKCAFKYTDYNQILFRFGHICELYIKKYCRTTHNWAKKIPEQHDHFILLWFHEIHNWCWHFFFSEIEKFQNSSLLFGVQ